jgi:hypothetical protein
LCDNFTLERSCRRFRGCRYDSRSFDVVTAIAALYFNVLLLTVQAFQKASFLKLLAPTQSEPPFVIAQAAAMLLFIVLGALAVFRFRPARSV